MTRLGKKPSPSIRLVGAVDGYQSALMRAIRMVEEIRGFALARDQHGLSVTQFARQSEARARLVGGQS